MHKRVDGECHSLNGICHVSTAVSEWALCSPSFSVGGYLFSSGNLGFPWVGNPPFPSVLCEFRDDNTVFKVRGVKYLSGVSDLVIFGWFWLVWFGFFFPPKSSSVSTAVRIAEAKATPTCIYAADV